MIERAEMGGGVCAVGVEGRGYSRVWDWDGEREKGEKGEKMGNGGRK